MRECCSTEKKRGDTNQGYHPVTKNWQGRYPSWFLDFAIDEDTGEEVALFKSPKQLKGTGQSWVFSPTVEWGYWLNILVHWTCGSKSEMCIIEAVHRWGFPRTHSGLSSSADVDIGHRNDFSSHALQVEITASYLSFVQSIIKCSIRENKQYDQPQPSLGNLSINTPDVVFPNYQFSTHVSLFHSFIDLSIAVISRPCSNTSDWQICTHFQFLPFGIVVSDRQQSVQKQFLIDFYSALLWMLFTASILPQPHSLPSNTTHLILSSMDQIGSEPRKTIPINYSSSCV